MRLNPKRKKVFFIILFLISIIVLGGTFLITPFLEKKILKEAQNVLGQEYDFKYSEFDLNLWTGSAIIKNLELSPKSITDSTTSHPTFSINIPGFEIKNLGYKELFFNKKIHLNKILLKNAQVNLKLWKLPEKMDNGTSLFNLIKKDFDELSIDLISIFEGEIIVRQMDSIQKSKLFIIKNFNLNIHKILLNEKTDQVNERLPEWENLEISSFNNSFRLPDLNHVLSLEALKWDQNTKKLILGKVKVKNLDNSTKALFDFDISEITCSDFDFTQLLQDSLLIDLVNINSPLIDVTINNKINTGKTIIDSAKTEEISDLPELRINKINIENGKILVHNQSNKFKLEVNGVSMQTNRIQIHQGGEDNVSNFLSKMSATSFNMIWANQLYDLKGGNIRISQGKNVEIENIQLNPKHDKYKFARTNNVQIDRMEIKCPKVSIMSMDISSLMEDQAVIAKEIIIPGLSINAFRDKRLDDDESKKPLPVASLKSLDFLVDVQKLSLENFNVQYTELGKDTKMEGVISFNDIKVKMYNITNSSKNKKDMKVVASGKLYNAAFIKAELNFNINDPQGRFWVTASSTGMEMKHFNSILKSSEYIYIKDGYVDSLKLSMNANDISSYGDLALFYHDADIEIHREKYKKKKNDKSKIGTFLVDKLLTKSSNPQNGKFRPGQISFERLQNKSIFNYLAKSVISGMVSSIAPAVGTVKQVKTKTKNLKEERKSNRADKKKKE